MAQIIIGIAKGKAVYMVAETESQLVQVRLPEPVVRAVRHWAIDQRLTLSQAIERLLERGLAEESPGEGRDDRKA